ncbi:MAG: hypothetical protein MJ211_00835 [Bacteroidales bacterium]|nr:hypothetical protein [Bacteroidales bacterium]
MNKQIILNTFILLLLLFNNKYLLAQEQEETEEVYSAEFLKTYEIYKKAIFNSIEQTIDFKSLIGNISINYYDLKKSSNFTTPEIIYNENYEMRQKLSIGFGKFICNENIDILKTGYRNNDILFVFSNLKMYIQYKIPNSSPNEYFKFYKFNTKPMIYDKETPLVLIVDKNANISQSLLNQILNIQETKLISKQLINRILMNTKSLKILAYKLKNI